MFSKFSATVDGSTLNWSPNEPCLSGDESMARKVQKLLDSTTLINLAAGGPSVVAISADASAVYVALNQIYGHENISYENEPNIDPLIGLEDEIRDITY